MKRRHQQRRAARQAENAELCELPLSEYLALPRRERKRRVNAALDRVPIKVVGSGFLPIPGERRRRVRATLFARRMLQYLKRGPVR